MEKVWQVAVFSIASLIALFVLTKLMGKRQISQMTMFDYIIGISFGSLAAEMAAHPEEESWIVLEAMAIYALITLLINFFNMHSLKSRKVFLGAPLVILDRGKLYFSSLKKAKIDLNELLGECRTAGYFDLEELEMILLEVNGKLSFLPRSQNRPLTAADISRKTKPERPSVAVVMDGVLLSEKLRDIGYDEKWLQRQMSAAGYPDCKNVLLAMVNEGKLTVYPREDSSQPKKSYT